MNGNGTWLKVALALLGTLLGANTLLTAWTLENVVELRESSAAMRVTVETHIADDNVHTNGGSQ